MATPYKLGWHSFKFDYKNASFSIPLLLTDEQKEVIEAANVHAENQRLLDLYRDEKKSHQDAIAVLNDQISMMQAALLVSKQDLKTAINAL